MMRYCLTVVALGAALACVAADQALYKNDLEKAPTGNLPDELLVLSGGFAVGEEGGNKFIELPGAPLETFGLLFGPTEATNVAVSARIFATGKGRRFPAFAVGLNGNAGYKLQVSAAKKAIELWKGEDVVKSTPFEWKSGAWTHLYLQARAGSDGSCLLEGKAWAEGSPPPKEFLISYKDATLPSAGRASIWGNPFSGTPIRFDDLLVTRVSSN